MEGKTPTADKIDNTHDKMLVSLFESASWAMNMVNQYLKPYNLTMQQFNVLRILRGQFPQPSTLQLVQERMIDSMSNATRLIEKLRQKGLVTRELRPDNRRKVDILITEDGLSLLNAAENAHRKWITQMEQITEQEAQVVLDVMKKLRDSDRSHEMGS